MEEKAREAGKRKRKWTLKRNNKKQSALAQRKHAAAANTHTNARTGERKKQRNRDKEGMLAQNLDTITRREKREGMTRKCEKTAAAATWLSSQGRISEK